MMMNCLKSLKKGSGDVYDLTGKVFGDLIVLCRKDGKRQSGKQVAWLCQCECGKTTSVLSWNLRSGHTTSCGCKRNEKLKNGLRTSHQLINHRLYSIWENMKQRCYNPNVDSYKYYGARGITICDAWKNHFVVFYNWAMANGYSNDLTIDRKDNDKGYFPSNCRWATMQEQANNKRGAT